MGSTSTTNRLQELQDKYDALPNKRSREGVALRKAIAAEKARSEAGEDASPPTPQEEAEERDASRKESKAPAAESFAHSESISPAELTSSTGDTVMREPSWGAGAPADGDEGILPNLERILRTEKSAIYWIGVLPGNPETGHNVPPSHQIDGVGGGISFHEWWTPHEGKGQDGSPRRGQYAGHLVKLTESQIVQLREGLRTTVVRWRVRRGFHKHGYVVRIPGLDQIEGLKERMGLNESEVARLKVRANSFELEEGDEPVARYIYCVKVEGPEAVAGAKWRPSAGFPPSVEQMGRIDGP